MTRLRAVLFDLHGTLVFSARELTREQYIERYAERAAPLLHAWGIDLEPSGLCRDLLGAVESAWEMVTPGGQHVDCPFIVRGAFADRGIDLTPAQAAAFWYAGRLPLAEYAQLFPDTLDVLRELRNAGLRLALVTNQPYPAELLLPDLASHRLLDRFDAVVVSHDVGFGKPHRAIFERAVEALGVGPGEALMVGDTPELDVAGAKNAGVMAALKRNGDRRRRAPEADYTIDDLIELLTLPCMPPGIARPQVATSPTPHEDDNEGRY